MMILKYALANAYRYGKADAGAVASKVFGEDPEARADAKRTLSEVQKVVKEVNLMKPEVIGKKLKEIAPELMEAGKHEEKREMKEIEGTVKGHVVVRLPPEPNGHPHIGHVMSFYFNYLYAKNFRGKVVLKFEDTNPLKEKPEYYDEIRNDLTWAGVKWAEVFCISEHFAELEEGVEKLIRLGKAYACECSPEKIKKDRFDKNADPCRDRPAEESLKIWRAMKGGKKAIIRWKGDPEAENSVLRDPTLYRTVDAIHPHTKKNHMVYPTYDFASSFTDGLIGVTHVLRSEEFLMRAELHKAIISALGMNPPVYKHYGRYELEGSPTSKRFLRPLVEEKKVEGWDDPRLPTIKALRRKGIVPKTFEDLVNNCGYHQGKSVLSWKLINGLNRKNLDPIAGRFFVVKEPVKLENDGPEREVEIPLFPDGKKHRKLKIGKTVYIEKSDCKNKAKLRLKGAYNIEVNGKKAKYAGEEMMRPIVHWLSEFTEAELWICEKLFEGEKIVPIEKAAVLAEPEISQFKGDYIQMERVGFARIDSRKPLRLIRISD